MVLTAFRQKSARRSGQIPEPGSVRSPFGIGGTKERAASNAVPAKLAEIVAQSPTDLHACRFWHGRGETPPRAANRGYSTWSALPSKMRPR